MVDEFRNLKKEFNKKFVKTGCVNDLDLGLFWGWIIENFDPVKSIVRQGDSQPVQTADTNRPKKYLVFAFEDYYPGGGLNDLMDESFDTLEDAKKYAESICRDNTQIVDRDTWDFY